jgi:hypothetical protein
VVALLETFLAAFASAGSCPPEPHKTAAASSGEECALVARFLGEIDPSAVYCKGLEAWEDQQEQEQRWLGKLGRVAPFHKGYYRTISGSTFSRLPRWDTDY